MKYVVLAHGGHMLVFFMPLAAIVYLGLALRAERTKKPDSSTTPRLPTTPFSRQVRAATTPPKAKQARKAASPVPPTFMPSKRSKETTGPKGVPRHLQQKPEP